MLVSFDPAVELFPDSQEHAQVTVAKLRTENSVPDADAPWTVFFQAEDGIRDIGVTGVQTCALPRSEERRVGKECRSRWSPYH